MRVLQVVPSFAPAYRYGGPIVSVLRLCRALRDSGVDVHVATTNCDGPADLDVPIGRAVEVEGVPVTYFRRYPRIDYAFSPALLAHLLASARNYDLVHITSTFSFPSVAAGVAARRANLPYVVSPRGSLQTWSVRQKRWKKQPYWSLLERRHLERAQFIHVTSAMEEAELRPLLPKVRMVMIPNGVDIESAHDVPRQPDRIVFLGRIHRKKGFDVLVPALARVARQRPNVETLIAGPDDDGEWSRVEQMLARVTPRPNVKYVGAIVGKEKYQFLAGASAFVLSSHAENFGQAVVEALACGTPVVVSRNTPWHSVAESGAGYWVENTPEAVADALLSILVNPDRAAAMAHAARAVAAKFNWASVGRAMAQAYAEVL